MYSFSITKKYDKKDRIIAKINAGENDGEFIKLEENDRKIKKKLMKLQIFNLLIKLLNMRIIFQI